MLNALAQGAVSTKLTSPEAAQKLGHVKATAARSLAQQRILRSFAVTARERRSLGLTGVQTSRAVASLLKQPVDDQGYMNFSKVKQVSLRADSMVEPPDTKSIDMLEALPQDDALFYSCEQHVIDATGKSGALFKELEAHYGFVGGTEEEYLKYLARSDAEWKTFGQWLVFQQCQRKTHPNREN